MLSPVTPVLTDKVVTFFKDDEYTWDSIDESLLNHKINQFKPLLGRIEDKNIEQLIKPKK